MSEKSWCYLKVGSYRVKIDREDLARVEEHSWRVTEGTTGRKRVLTSIRGPQGARNVTLGKFLMKPGKGKQVYPRRFNEELDYRKSNLVVCTLQERQQQMPKNRKKASSRYRGVSYSKTTGRWRAGIEVKGKSINLGEFKSEEVAAQTYNKAARKYFGANAYQNPVGREKVRRRS